MNVYFCSYKGFDWGCFVAAGTHNQAKSLFHSYCRENLYADVRSSILERGVQIPAGVFDMETYYESL